MSGSAAPYAVSDVAAHQHRRASIVELVAQIAGAYQQLSPAERQVTVLLASNYGEAGAIGLYGPGFGLPPALSPYLTYWYWKRAHVAATNVITVGFDEPRVRDACAEVARLATIEPVHGVRSEEVGRPILLCRQPTAPARRPLAAAAQPLLSIGLQQDLRQASRSRVMERCHPGSITR